jgi:hypothetical protein
MNKILVIVVGLLFALSAQAAIKGAPYQPEIDSRFDALEGPVSTSPSGISSLHLATAVYNVAVNGGTSTAHDLGVSLPAGAVIVRSFYDVNTIFADDNAIATLAVSCETANNIVTAAAVRASGPHEGVSTGASTVFKKITAACPITATPAVAPFTAGKATIFVEYVITQQ